jgi:hypothetical protein
MTYPELLQTVYVKYDRLLAAWNTASKRSQSVGVFMFLPEGYSSAKVLEDTDYSFLTLDEVKGLLGAGQGGDQGFLEVFEAFVVGEEFFVMIVEAVENEKRKAVHIHKITKMNLN